MTGQMSLFDFINRQVTCRIDNSFQCNHAEAKKVAISCGEDCKQDCCLSCKELCGARCYPSAHLQKPPTKEAPILLQPHQTVYIVTKGDVREADVYAGEPSWLCGKDDRGYRLKHKNGCYNCTWNSHIGVDCFTEKESAEEKAELFLSIHDVILAEDIKPISTVTYQYLRDADNRTMTAFYCELENGLYYIKNFITFHHISDKKGIKKFKEQQEFEFCQPEQVEYTPEFRNMYKCTKESEWIYAEAGYSYAVG